MCQRIWKIFIFQYLDRSPAFLTSDNFITSNKIVRTNWLIYQAIRKAGDQSKYT